MFWNSILVTVTQCYVYAKKPLNDTLFFLFSCFFFGGGGNKVFLESFTILLLFCVSGFLAKRHGGSELPHQGSNPHLLH